MPAPAVSRVLLYVHDLEGVADFYCTYFGFTRKPQKHHDLIEIVAADGKFSLLLHQATKGNKKGQSCIKLVFDVEDIEGFKREAAQKGLKFGVTHKGEGYEFANARDPAKNPIQISRRAFMK